MKNRIIVGISGASGVIYGVRTLQHLQGIDNVETHLVLSEGGALNVKIETEHTPEELCDMADVVHRPNNLAASIASGFSSQWG